MLVLYVIATLQNPGCAEYKPKAELTMSSFQGRWYAQYLSRVMIDKYKLG